MEKIIIILKTIRNICLEVGKLLFFVYLLLPLFYDIEYDNEYITRLILLIGWILIVDIEKLNERLNEKNKK